MNGRPPARARSPPKTTLNSPARRAPGLASSSPLRAANLVRGSPSGAKSFQRKLDFKNNPLANRPVLPKPNGVNGKGKGKAAAITNGHHRSSEEEEQEGEEEVEEEEEEEEVDESMAILDGGEDGAVEDEEVSGELELERGEAETEEEPEEPEEPSPPSVKKGRGRPKKTAPAAPVHEEDAIVESIEDREPSEELESTGAGKRQRGPTKGSEDEAPQARKKAKKASTVDDEAGESSNQAAAPKRRGRKPKAAVAAAGGDNETSVPAKKAAVPKQKRAGKRTSAGVGDTSVAEIPRGPPMPRGRGLVITRREDPGAGSGFTTRSGRTSYQPLKFWRNERAELDDEALLEDGKSKIVLPHVKNIVRIDEPEPELKSSSRRKTKPSGKKGGRRRGGFQIDDDGDDDLERWEEEGEIITGEVVVWQPEHELNPPGPDEQIEVAPDEQIAVSANAITTREIRNASFKFAKTLSMPFFGSGVVDLPPGTEKKPKNSRKMHMTFFVFAGRVTVTVADTLFSIGRGGMWFVPRGK